MDTSNSKKRMLEALEKNKGVVSYAAKDADIARSTHYAWLNEDPEYKKAVEEIANVALDFVEKKLFENIDEGDTSAMIFYLKTQGKKRGYVERQEVTGKDGETLFTDINVNIVKSNDKGE